MSAQWKFHYSNLDDCDFNTILMKERGIAYPSCIDEEQDSEQQGGVQEAVITKVKKPPLYKVLIHNDDYTTMEFVVWVLKKFFGKTQEQADAIMLKVHHEGVGICGIYTFEVAETKVEQVSRAARSEGHPLKCSLEPE